jgi:hypothetical protein
MNTSIRSGIVVGSVMDSDRMSRSVRNLKSCLKATNDTRLVKPRVTWFANDQHQFWHVDFGEVNELCCVTNVRWITDQRQVTPIEILGNRFHGLSMFERYEHAAYIVLHDRADRYCERLYADTDKLAHCAMDWYDDVSVTRRRLVEDLARRFRRDRHFNANRYLAGLLADIRETVAKLTAKYSHQQRDVSPGWWSRVIRALCCGCQ